MYGLGEYQPSAAKSVPDITILISLIIKSFDVSRISHTPSFLEAFFDSTEWRYTFSAKILAFCPSLKLQISRVSGYCKL